MSKPIEIGSMVMLIRSVNPDNIGRVGTVVEIDSGSQFKYRVEGSFARGATSGWSRPGWLIRIDDYDPSQDVVEDDKEMEKC